MAGVFNYNDFEEDKTTLKADVDANYGNPISEGTENGVLPGDVKYVDVNQDGVINDDDRTIIARTH